MAKSYYQIELTGRQLTVFVIVIAVLLIVAFVLGYGAAWSMLGGPRGTAGGTPLPSPVPMPETVVPSPSPSPAISVMPTATPTIAPASPTPVPSVQATPAATPTRSVRRAVKRAVKRRVPTPKPPSPRFWVQVLAARRPAEIRRARRKLTKLGFPSSHQEVVKVRAEAGYRLYKLRVGPLPDRASAGRVMERMRAEGFPDAWVVVP